jgi:hypothetical protein
MLWNPDLPVQTKVWFRHPKDQLAMAACSPKVVRRGRFRKQAAAAVTSTALFKENNDG